MADYFHAHIDIGGTLPIDKVPEFLALINGCGDGDFGNQPFSLEELKATEETFFLESDQARYGEFPELESFCVANQLPYRRFSEGKYEFNPEVVVFDGVETYFSCTDTDGDICLSLADLRQARNAGRSLQDIIDAQAPFMAELPPLTVGPPVTE